MDRQTAQPARFAHHRGKQLPVMEIGTFYYGWRFNNPAGAASADATLTVAEGVIRGLNIGAECFAFWSLMNPNSIDGHWGNLRIEGGRLVRCGHPFAVYGMLSRTIRPGSRVYPLSISPGGALCPLHGTFLERRDGFWAVLLVNDSPTQNLPIELVLPEGAPAGEWAVQVTDHVRLNQPLAPALPTAERLLHLTIPSFSLLTMECPPPQMPG